MNLVLKKNATKERRPPKVVPKPTMLSERQRQGLVIVITGNGKGKTTSALGQALRMLGHGYKVCMIQFMKGRKDGECLATERYLPGLSIRLCGLDSFVMRDNPAPMDFEMAKEGLALAKREVDSRKWDMVILDEINVAIDFKLVPLTDVLDLIEKKPSAIDLILTGRNAPPELIERADTVSEVREIKHHYATGIKNRAGIEY